MQIDRAEREFYCKHAVNSRFSGLFHGIVTKISCQQANLLDYKMFFRREM
ncbi:MAG: hypothetical protein ACI9R3_001298 [Verrucomicrobiales bacterium]|jgi:hypothetical protein